jgi:hypothetical protein
MINPNFSCFFLPNCASKAMALGWKSTRLTSAHASHAP